MWVLELVGRVGPNWTKLKSLGTFTPGTFPALDEVPPIDSPQVQAWIQEVANSGVTIPNLSVTVNDADCGSNAAAAADTSRCWWTCGQCTRETDIVECPDKLTWGVSYDDGPSDYTADLLNFFDDHQMKATMFIVGSRVSRIVHGPMKYSNDELLAGYFSTQHSSGGVHGWSSAVSTHMVASFPQYVKPASSTYYPGTLNCLL